MNYPTLVYKSPGKLRHRSGKTYKYMGVANEDELNRAIADGWNVSKEDAINGKPAELPDHVIENAPPTRAEMETKAKQLGVKFDGRTSDKKLLMLIEKALENSDGLD